MSAPLPSLRAALEREALSVTPRGDRIAVSARSGLRARRVELSDEQASELIDGLDESERRAALAAFARGLAAALSEPEGSDAADMPFVEAAAVIVPVVDTRAYAEGVVAAGLERPFTVPLTESLFVAFEVELDDGVHVLGDAQVAAWGATPERVLKAAVSILYHRTWGLSWDKPDEDGVTRFDGRDGRDAARATILDLWDHERARRGFLVAMPAPGVLLSCDDTTDRGVAALTARARAEFEDACSPLSPHVWRFDDGRLAPRPVGG